MAAEAAAVERSDIGQYRGVRLELVTVDATGAAHFPHKLQQYQQAFASMMG